MRNSIITFAAAALLALPGAVSGQNTADIQALAEVLSPIDVTAVSDLDFGQVLPGVPTVVAPGALTGGAFTVSGALNEAVFVVFTLPTELVDGTLTMPVSFDAAHGAGASTPFDPTTSPTLTLDGSGDLELYLGGTVTPAVSQAAGNYSGTVTLTVTYPTT